MFVRAHINPCKDTIIDYNTRGNRGLNAFYCKKTTKLLGGFKIMSYLCTRKTARTLAHCMVMAG